MRSYFLTTLTAHVCDDERRGPVSDDQARAAPALCQRAFIFDVMARSIPIALLRGAVFRDSKVGDFPSRIQALAQVSYRFLHSSLNKDCSLTLGAF